MEQDFSVPEIGVLGIELLEARRSSERCGFGFGFGRESLWHFVEQVMSVIVGNWG